MKRDLPAADLVARRLRELREARGIRREAVALALDMGAENVRHYESGRTALTVPMLPVIAETYGMRLDELLAELFDLREICNNQAISANGMPDKDSANYNYTRRADWLSGLGNTRRPGLALATVG